MLFPLSFTLQDDPGPIVLNTDSLRQFSGTLDYDFDVVVSAVTTAVVHSEEVRVHGLCMVRVHDYSCGAQLRSEGATPVRLSMEVNRSFF